MRLPNMSQEKKQNGEKANDDRQKAKTKSTDDLMTEASLQDMPIKSLVLYGGGILDYEMCDGLLMMLNKQKGGLKALVKAFGIR